MFTRTTHLLVRGMQTENEVMSVNLEEILNLSVKERLELIEEIWDSLASEPQRIPLTSAQSRELDRRKREHIADPTAAAPWSQVRDRLQKRKK